MPATFSKLVTVSAGQTITASERNAEFDNILNNLDPSGVGDYSVNTTQMQATADPYPGGVESLATSLAGELERIRYVIKQITGKAQWYIDPVDALPTGGTTKIPFYMAAPPTGWTAVALNDKFLRVVTSGTTGGTSGGSGATPSSTVTLAHTHTVNGHVHDLSNHTHSMPTHQHIIDYALGTNNITGTTAAVWSSDSDGATIKNDGTASPTANQRQIKNTTKTDGSGTSGTPSSNSTSSASPGTDSQLSNHSFVYSDLVIASRD